MGPPGPTAATHSAAEASAARPVARGSCRQSQWLLPRRKGEILKKVDDNLLPALMQLPGNGHSLVARP